MTLSSNTGRRLRHVLACAVLVLTACGGGTSQYEPFVPQRLVAFGDQSSVLTDGGRRYSINGLVDSAGVVSPGGTFDCESQPIWVQTLAATYGFVFAECNPGPTPVAEPQAIMRAEPDTLAANVQQQIDAQVAAGGFREGDLTTVLAGANDIIALYQQYSGTNEAELTDELRARGRALAQQVNRLVDLGAKVIVSTVPDMGLTPYALQQRAAFSDVDRAAMLSRLTAAFNEQLGVTVLLDGRFVGLVQADLRVQTMVRVPGAFGLTNVTAAACPATALPPVCDSGHLAEGVTASNHLWADDQNLAYSGHAQLGALAVDRAQRNPF